MYNYEEQARSANRPDPSFQNNINQPPASVPSEGLKSATGPQWPVPRPVGILPPNYRTERSKNNHMTPLIESEQYQRTVRTNSTNQHNIIRPQPRTMPIDCQTGYSPYAYYPTRSAPHYVTAENVQTIGKRPMQFTSSDPRYMNGSQETLQKTPTEGRMTNYSRYTTEMVASAQQNSVPSLQERIVNHHIPFHESPNKDNSHLNCTTCQTSSCAHIQRQTACAYAPPIPTLQQPSGSWPGSHTQSDMWAIRDEQRQMLPIEGIDMSVSNSYAMQYFERKNNDTGNTNDMYKKQQAESYQIQKQHINKLKKLQSGISQHSRSMEWSHEGLGSSGIIQPYPLGRYPDPNQRGQISRAIPSHLSLPMHSTMSSESYKLPENLNYINSNSHLHSRLTSAYPPTNQAQITKGTSYFSHPHANYAAPVSSHHNMNPESASNQSFPKPTYSVSVSSYPNPPLNSCNERYENINYGQTMQVVDNSAVNKGGVPFQQELHQAYKPPAPNYFDPKSVNTLDMPSSHMAYNAMYRKSVAESVRVSRHKLHTSYGIMPSSGANIQSSRLIQKVPTNYQHEAPFVEMTLLDDCDQLRKRRKQDEVHVIHSVNRESTENCSDKKRPADELRKFYENFDVEEVDEAAEATGTESVETRKPQEMIVLDCTNLQEDNLTQPNKEICSEAEVQGYKFDSQNENSYTSVIKPLKERQKTSTKVINPLRNIRKPAFAASESENFLSSLHDDHRGTNKEINLMSNLESMSFLNESVEISTQETSAHGSVESIGMTSKPSPVEGGPVDSSSLKRPHFSTESIISMQDLHDISLVLAGKPSDSEKCPSSTNPASDVPTQSTCDVSIQPLQSQTSSLIEPENFDHLSNPKESKIKDSQDKSQPHWDRLPSAPLQNASTFTRSRHLSANSVTTEDSGVEIDNVISIPEVDDNSALFEDLRAANFIPMEHFKIIKKKAKAYKPTKKPSDSVIKYVSSETQKNPMLSMVPANKPLAYSKTREPLSAVDLSCKSIKSKEEAISKPIQFQNHQEVSQEMQLADSTTMDRLSYLLADRTADRAHRDAAIFNAGVHTAVRKPDEDIALELTCLDVNKGTQPSEEDKNTKLETLQHQLDPQDLHGAARPDFAETLEEVISASPIPSDLHEAERHILPKPALLSSPERFQLPSPGNLRSTECIELPAPKSICSPDRLQSPAPESLCNLELPQLTALKRVSIPRSNGSPTPESMCSPEHNGSLPSGNSYIQERLQRTPCSPERIETLAPENLSSPEHVESPAPENLCGPEHVDSPAPENLCDPEHVDLPAPENLCGPEHVESPAPENLCTPEHVDSPAPQNLCGPEHVDSPAPETLCSSEHVDLPAPENLCGPEHVESPAPENLCTPEHVDSPAPENLCGPEDVESPAPENLCGPEHVDSPAPENLCSPEHVDLPAPENLCGPEHVDSPALENLCSSEHVDSSAPENLCGPEHVDSPALENLCSSEHVDSSVLENLCGPEDVDSPAPQNLCTPEHVDSPAPENLCGAEDVELPAPENLCGAEHVDSLAPENLCGAEHVESSVLENLCSPEHVESPAPENLSGPEQVESLTLENLCIPERVESLTPQNLCSPEHVEPLAPENLCTPEHLQSTTSENKCSPEHLQYSAPEKWISSEHNDLPAPENSCHPEQLQSPAPKSTCSPEHLQSPTPGGWSSPESNESRTPRSLCSPDHLQSPTPAGWSSPDRNDSPAPQSLCSPEQIQSPVPEGWSSPERYRSPTPEAFCHSEHLQSPAPVNMSSPEQLRSPSTGVWSVPESNGSPVPGDECSTECIESLKVCSGSADIDQPSDHCGQSDHIQSPEILDSDKNKQPTKEIEEIGSENRKTVETLNEDDCREMLKGDGKFSDQEQADELLSAEVDTISKLSKDTSEDIDKGSTDKDNFSSYGDVPEIHENGKVCSEEKDFGLAKEKVVGENGDQEQLLIGARNEESTDSDHLLHGRTVLGTVENEKGAIDKDCIAESTKNAGDEEIEQQCPFENNSELLKEGQNGEKQENLAVSQIEEKICLVPDQEKQVEVLNSDASTKACDMPMEDVEGDELENSEFTEERVEFVGEEYFETKEELSTELAEENRMDYIEENEVKNDEDMVSSLQDEVHMKLEDEVCLEREESFVEIIHEIDVEQEEKADARMREFDEIDAAGAIAMNGEDQYVSSRVPEDDQEDFVDCIEDVEEEKCNVDIFSADGDDNDQDLMALQNKEIDDPDTSLLADPKNSLLNTKNDFLVNLLSNKIEQQGTPTAGDEIGQSEDSNKKVTFEEQETILATSNHLENENDGCAPEEFSTPTADFSSTSSESEDAVDGLKEAEIHSLKQHTEILGEDSDMYEPGFSTEGCSIVSNCRDGVTEPEISSKSSGCDVTSSPSDFPFVEKPPASTFGASKHELLNPKTDSEVITGVNKDPATKVGSAQKEKEQDMNQLSKGSKSWSEWKKSRKNFGNENRLNHVQLDPRLNRRSSPKKALDDELKRDLELHASLTNSARVYTKNQDINPCSNFLDSISAAFKNLEPLPLGDDLVSEIMNDFNEPETIEASPKPALSIVCPDSEMPALEIGAVISPVNSESLEMPCLEAMSDPFVEASSPNCLLPALNSDSIVASPERCITNEENREPISETFGTDEPLQNWPYLEEEVFSETPRNQSPVIETTCSGQVYSPAPSYTTDSDTPFSKDLTNVPCERNIYDKPLNVLAEARSPIPQLKCSLSWDKIFNLSKTNKKNLRDIGIKSTGPHHKKMLLSNLPDFCKKINEKKDKKRSSLQERDDEFDLELGPATIEVRLKPNGNRRQWNVVDGIKTENGSEMNLREENNNITESGNQTRNVKSPIVVVQRIILKRRAEEMNDSVPNEGGRSQGPSCLTTPPESDDGSPSQKALPKVVIKRTRHGHSKYQSFLRLSEGDGSRWQPVVQIERNQLLENMVKRHAFFTNLPRGNFDKENEQVALPTLDHFLRETSSVKTPFNNSHEVEEDQKITETNGHRSLKYKSRKHSKVTKDKASSKSILRRMLNSTKANTGSNSTVYNIFKPPYTDQQDSQDQEVIKHSGRRHSDVCAGSNPQIPERRQRNCSASELSMPVVSQAAETSVVITPRPRGRPRKVCIERGKPPASAVETVEAAKPEEEKISEPVPKIFTCLACKFVFEEEAEMTAHVQTHSYHCQKCNVAFIAEPDFERHLLAEHPDTKQLHHCLLCKLCFACADEHATHVASAAHSRLELTQRWTIQTLFALFTGAPCAQIAPLTDAEAAEMSSLAETVPGAINYYHQPTPLQLAVQDLLSRDARSPESETKKKVGEN